MLFWGFAFCIGFHITQGEQIYFWPINIGKLKPFSLS